MELGGDVVLTAVRRLQPATSMPPEGVHGVGELRRRDAQHHPRVRRPAVVVGRRLLLGDLAGVAVDDLLDLELCLPDVVGAQVDVALGSPPGSSGPVPGRRGSCLPLRCGPWADARSPSVNSPSRWAGASARRSRPPVGARATAVTAARAAASRRRRRRARRRARAEAGARPARVGRVGRSRRLRSGGGGHASVTWPPTDVPRRGAAWSAQHTSGRLGRWVGPGCAWWSSAEASPVSRRPTSSPPGTTCSCWRLAPGRRQSCAGRRSPGVTVDAIGAEAMLNRRPRAWTSPTLGLPIEHPRWPRRRSGPGALRPCPRVSWACRSTSPARGLRRPLGGGWNGSARSGRARIGDRGDVSVSERWSTRGSGPGDRPAREPLLGSVYAGMRACSRLRPRSRSWWRSPSAGR